MQQQKTIRFQVQWLGVLIAEIPKWDRFQNGKPYIHSPGKFKVRKWFVDRRALKFRNKLFDLNGFANYYIPKDFVSIEDFIEKLKAIKTTTACLLVKKNG